MLLFWHVFGNYNTFCILTKQSILKQSCGNTKAKFYCKKRFDVQRTHWLEIVKETETLGVQLPSITANSVPISEKKEVPPWRSPSIYFLKEKKKFSILKLEPHKLLKARWMDKVFIETTMKVIILLIVNL